MSRKQRFVYLTEESFETISEANWENFIKSLKIDFVFLSIDIIQ